METICYVPRLTTVFNSWTTQGLHKGEEIFKSWKIQCLGLRQLEKVYTNLIALSKEAKHNTPLVLNLLLRYN